MTRVCGEYRGGIDCGGRDDEELWYEGGGYVRGGQLGQKGMYGGGGEAFAVKCLDLAHQSGRIRITRNGRRVVYRGVCEGERIVVSRTLPKERVEGRGEMQNFN